MKTFLFTYFYKGHPYQVEIVADTQQEASERIDRIRYSQYTGELMMTLPVGMGWLSRLICWWKS